MPDDPARNGAQRSVSACFVAKQRLEREAEQPCRGESPQWSDTLQPMTKLILEVAAGVVVRHLLGESVDHPDLLFGQFIKLFLSGSCSMSCFLGAGQTRYISRQIL